MLREPFLPANVVSGKRGNFKEGQFAAPVIFENVHSCYKYAPRVTSGKSPPQLIKSLPFSCKKKIENHSLNIPAFLHNSPEVYLI